MFFILLFLLTVIVLIGFPLLLELSNGGVYKGSEEELQALLQNHCKVVRDPLRPNEDFWLYSKNDRIVNSIFDVCFSVTKVFIGKYHFHKGQVIPNKYNHIIESIGKED